MVNKILILLEPVELLTLVSTELKHHSGLYIHGLNIPR